MSRWAVAALAGAAAALLATGCDVNEYCVSCADLDAAVVDSLDQGDGTIGDGGGNDACIPGAVEECNGVDDDCDLMVDEDVPQVGVACGTDVGECTSGVYECTAGQLRCSGQGGSPEQCNDLDDDCDNMTDEGNPGGGASCGSDLGECVAGVTQCVAGGTLECVGAIGMPGQDPEICDGKDNDCDNLFDEGLTDLGPCGTTDTGECALGTLSCLGGAPVCQGAVGPTLEQCDALDHDCDGNPTNGFDLDNDPRNCGGCGTICTLTDAVAGCAMGACTVAACTPNHWDINGLPGDGCEYACQYQGPQEACNQVDDDCDGTIDEDLIAPPLCASAGACAGTMPSCTATGWDCVYGPDVSVDSNGDIVPESTCDAIDNDCDGVTDESHPLAGTACFDTGVGVCRGSGTYACDALDPDGPVTCQITTPGQMPSSEACDAKDNDCDGTVDEGAAQDWVAIGGGREIMKWEASRPDSTAGDAGSSSGLACSKAGVLPWTNVTYGQAQAACAAAGGSLCSEQDWHRACAVVSRTGFPVSEPGASNGYMFFEAEDYVSIAPGTSGNVTRVWVPDNSPAGFSGISALRSTPNTGANVSAGNAPTQAPRLDYLVDFTQTGNHYVWVRMYGPDNNDDDVHVGINPTLPGSVDDSLDAPSNSTWVWVRTSAISVPATGPRYVSVWMQRDGVRVDAIVVTRSSSTTAPTETRPAGGTWSYASNPTTYQLGVCNEDDYDTDPVAPGDQDGLLVGGDRASCYANWSATDHVHDLSGNVKEWTLARQPGANPIRGGASNNEGNGITCGLAFTLGSDSFFFPNVGFRCCR